MEARTDRASRACANRMLATEDPVSPQNFPEPESHVVYCEPNGDVLHASGSFRVARAVHNTTIATAAITIACAVLVAAGMLADALPPVITTVAGGVALIAVIMVAASREVGK